MQMPAKYFKSVYKNCSRKRGDLRHLLRKSRIELAEERMMEIQAELSQPSSSCCSSSVGSPSASPFLTTSTTHKQQSQSPKQSSSISNEEAATKLIRPNSSASAIKSCGNGPASSSEIQAELSQPSSSCSSSVGSPSASPFFTTSTTHQQQQSPKPSTSNGTEEAATKLIRPNSSASAIKSCGNGPASSSVVLVLEEHVDKASTSPYVNHSAVEEKETEPAGQQVQEHGLDGKQQEATSSNARVEEEEPIEDEHPEDEEETESLKRRKRPFINHKCQGQQMEQDESHAKEQQPQLEVKKPRLVMMAPKSAKEEEVPKKDDHLNGRRMNGTATTPDRRRSSCHGEDMPTLEELFSF